LNIVITVYCLGPQRTSSPAWYLLLCLLDMIVDNNLVCGSIPTGSDHTAHGVQVWMDVDTQFVALANNDKVIIQQFKQ
jgi:hypothetical protein